MGATVVSLCKCDVSVYGCVGGCRWCVYSLITYYKSKAIGCIFMHSFLTALRICGSVYCKRIHFVSLQMGIMCILRKKFFKEVGNP